MSMVRSSTRQRVVGLCSVAMKAAPGALVLYAMLTLAAGALPVGTAWLTKLLLDELIAEAPLATLIALGCGLVVTGVFVSVIPQLTRYWREQLDREVGLVAQDRLFTAVERFAGLGRFENPQFLDRLRLAQQAARVAVSEAADGALGLGRAMVTIVGFLGALFVLNPIVAALVMGSGVPTLIAELMLARKRMHMLWTIGPVERRELFYSDLLSTIEAAKEIRLFGTGTFLRARMLADRRTANAAKQAMDRWETFVQTGLGLLAAILSGGGLVWAVTAASAGILSVGGVTMFVAAVAGVQGTLAALATNVARAHQALLLFDQYLAVTSAGPDLPTSTPPRALSVLWRGIEFQDVWFRYSEAHPWILRGINLRIPFGKTVALVGLNGAGKSTMVKLLCRFYDPTRGAIRWDGIDLRDVDVTELRQRIGAVFQDYMQYDMTAGENIVLGDLGAAGDDERIKAAAQRAGIHRALSMLPRGYETLLSRMFFMDSEGDRERTGVALSGGQWQRLALARAFLRDQRDLMILDEPSAGLDAEAEHDIHTTLRWYRSGRTSLLVSHRLNAIREADIIAVLSAGLIVEQGDHAALIAANGDYARLFTLQASGYQAEHEFIGDGNDNRSAKLDDGAIQAQAGNCESVRKKHGACTSPR